MRIRVLSDLHRKFGPFDLPDVVADVVVLAGDPLGLLFPDRVRDRTLG